MRTLFALLLLSLLAGNAYAAGVGTIEPTLGFGEIRQEIGAFRQELEWESDNADVPMGNVVQNAAYLQAEYALDRHWIAFFRIGAADLVIEDVAPPDYAGVGRDLEGDFQLWGGGGIKGILVGANRPLSLGLFVEGRYFGPYSDDKSITVLGEPVKLEMNLDTYWAVQAALPLQLNLSAITIYAGPLLSLSNAELELTASGLGVSDTATATYTEASPFGAVAGAAFKFGDAARLCFDTRVGNGNGFGILLNFARLVY